MAEAVQYLGTKQSVSPRTRTVDALVAFLNDFLSKQVSDLLKTVPAVMNCALPTLAESIV